MESSIQPIPAPPPESLAPSARSCGCISKPFSEWPEIMSCPDIVSCCGLSKRRAYQILKSEQLQRPFPASRRNIVVSKHVLLDFLSGRVRPENHNLG